MTAFVYAFLYVPIFFMVFFSFNSSMSLSRWSSASWRWYQNLFHNPEIWDSFFISLKIATASATFSVLIGTLCALLFVRFSRIRGKGFWEFLSSIPLMMPEVITGLAFLVFFVTSENLTGWPMGRGISTVTIAHTTLSLAYVVIVVRARLLEFDLSLEEAALDLGAKPFQAFLSVTLPLIMPALFAGWLLAFTLSMDDFVIASFTSGPSSRTLPIFLFSKLRTGLTPEINALSTLIILFVSCLIPMVAAFMHLTVKKSLGTKDI
jgi:putrescine transport system permease protein